MPEFLELLPPSEALNLLLERLPVQVAIEDVETSSALGRVAANPIKAPYPLPSFSRTTVDGYAVRARDTFGASESLPAYLPVMGEVPMGSAPSFILDPGSCALIHTGGMLPQGADAVVMLEYTQGVSEGEVEFYRAAAVGENVLETGEDIEEGDVIVQPGVRLRPAEIGGLMALGITHLEVARRPKVGIISSGDEVIPPDVEVRPGQVRDINTYTLAALVEELGGIPISYGIVSDRFEPMKAAASKALEECDMLVVTAGSSASTRDLTSQVVDQLGPPGVLVHGVNVRPGKPTILSICNGKAVIGLPGNPVSALLIASIFIKPVLEALLGFRQSRPSPSLKARLTVNLASQAGREDWIPVRLLAGEQGYEADPVFGKSNLIFTLVRADGLIRIPADATGLAAGHMVDVIFF